MLSCCDVAIKTLARFEIALSADLADILDVIKPLALFESKDCQQKEASNMITTVRLSTSSGDTYSV